MDSRWHFTARAGACFSAAGLGIRRSPRPGARSNAHFFETAAFFVFLVRRRSATWHSCTTSLAASPACVLPKTIASVTKQPLSGSGSPGTRRSRCRVCVSVDSLPRPCRCTSMAVALKFQNNTAKRWSCRIERLTSTLPYITTRDCPSLCTHAPHARPPEDNGGGLALAACVHLWSLASTENNRLHFARSLN